MKTQFLVLAVLFGSIPLAAQNTMPATPPSTSPTPVVPTVDPVATEIWREHIEGMGDRGNGAKSVNYAQISGKAFEFFEKFPNERRVGGILFNLVNCGDWMKGEDTAELRDGWRKHLRSELADTLRTGNWPDNIWAGLQWVAAKNDMAIAMAATSRPDLPALKAHIAVVAARTPASPYRTFLEQDLVRALGQYHPEALPAHLTELSQSDVADLAALGRGQLAIQELKTKPMELSFTAVDGRRVDLADLRGNVVLIDCWATWCVPCVKELPNIRNALAKWGDKGFKVVGVSFDRVGDKDKLMKFIESESLVWPHWFNEQGGTNPFGKRFNIRSIPATFLLGRDGRLITTETHGEKLEAALAKIFAE